MMPCKHNEPRMRSKALDLGMKQPEATCRTRQPLHALSLGCRYRKMHM